VPVLAFLCDSERLQGPRLYRPRPPPKDIRLQKLNTWSDYDASARPIAEARPPPPYGLALLIGMAQMQQQIYSKKSSPPDTYRVCFRSCLVAFAIPYHLSHLCLHSFTPFERCYSR
jgi:hypothetical protein